MSNGDALQDKMAQIGVRYLARTLGEMARVRELAAQVETHTPGALKELERAAHKIHGSGAMFGFNDVSDRAREVEHLAASLGGGDVPDHLHRLSEDALRARLADAVAQLDRATRSAAKAAGVELHGG
jgi:HPt (histidine-containing phosphotransfer) domain-containing protein